MIDIKVTGDLKKAERYLTGLQRRAIPRVAVQSLNRAGIRMLSEASKAAGDAIGIKPKEAKTRMVLDKANRGRLYARVRPNAAGRRATNLIAAVSPGKRHPGAFSARSGVAARLGGKTKVYRGTFIIPASNSGKPIVVTRRNAERLPVVAKSLPSVAGVLTRDQVRDRAISKGVEVWRSEFPRNLARATAQLEARSK